MARRGRAPRHSKADLAAGPQSGEDLVPVGRRGRHAAAPGREIEYDGRRIKYPDTRLMYSIGGNPFHHNGNLNRFLEGMAATGDGDRPRALVEPGGQACDIVLPATTTMERNDILAPEDTPLWIAMKQVIDPWDRRATTSTSWPSLASRLGFGHAYTQGRDEMGWLQAHVRGGPCAGPAHGLRTAGLPRILGVRAVLNSRPLHHRRCCSDSSGKTRLPMR